MSRRAEYESTKSGSEWCSPRFVLSHSVVRLRLVKAGTNVLLSKFVIDVNGFPVHVVHESLSGSIPDTYAKVSTSTKHNIRTSSHVLQILPQSGPTSAVHLEPDVTLVDAMLEVRSCVIQQPGRSIVLRLVLSQ